MKFDEPRNHYTSTKDFILVHKTNYPPQNDTIKTAKSAGAKNRFEIELDGQTYELEVPFERETIHFAVNGEVGSHTLGNWDSMKYAILIPFTDIPKEQVVNANTVDTFTYGDVSIPPTGYILCPAKEVEELKLQNPSANIIGYEGDKVLGHPSLIIQQLGYQIEECGEHDWYDRNSGQQFAQIVQEDGYYWSRHTGSKFERDQNRNTLANEVIEVLKLIKDKRNATK